MRLEIIEDQRLLRCDGRDVALGARAFDVLCHLYRHADLMVEALRGTGFPE